MQKLVGAPCLPKHPGSHSLGISARCPTKREIKEVASKIKRQGGKREYVRDKGYTKYREEKKPLVGTTVEKTRDQSLELKGEGLMRQAPGSRSGRRRNEAKEERRLEA